MPSILELARQHTQKCNEAAQAIGPAIFGTQSKGYPHESVGLSCHPSQAAEFQQYARDHGISGVSFDKRGRCTVESPAAYKRYRRLRGAHFNNAYND